MKNMLWCLMIVCGPVFAQATSEMDFSKRLELQKSCRDKQAWKTDECKRLVTVLEAQDGEADAKARDIRKEMQQLCGAGGSPRICQEAYCPVGTDTHFTDAELRTCAEHFKLPSAEKWVATRRSDDGAYWVSCLVEVDYLTEVGARAFMRPNLKVTQGTDGRFRSDALESRGFATLDDAVNAGCPVNMKAMRPFIERTGGTVIK